MPRSYRRLPRNHKPLPEGSVDLEPPGAEASQPALWDRFMQVLQPGAQLTATGALLVAGAGGLALAGGAILLSSAFAVERGIRTGVRGGRDFARKKTEREAGHNRVLLYAVERLDKSSQKQREALAEIHPAPEECVAIVKRALEQAGGVRNEGSSLWERGKRDKDFLELRLGMGGQPLSVEIVYPKREIRVEANAETKELIALGQRFEWVGDVPVFLDLKQHPVVALTGSPEQREALSRALVMQIATHHAPSEVKTAFVGPGWSWARWLPHCWSDERDRRYLASRQVETLLKYLHEMLGERIADDGPKVSGAHLVIFMSASPRVLPPGMLDRLAESRARATVIFLTAPSCEPRQCTAVLKLTPERVLKRAEELFGARVKKAQELRDSLTEERLAEDGIEELLAYFKDLESCCHSVSEQGGSVKHQAQGLIAQLETFQSDIERALARRGTARELLTGLVKKAPRVESKVVTELLKNCAEVMTQLKTLSERHCGQLFKLKHDDEPFIPDLVELDLADRFARCMAPLRLDEPGVGGGVKEMPSFLSLFDVLGVHQVEAIDVESQWRKNAPFEGLTVPLGVRQTGETFELDLLACGPHGLVAGTPGWGKTAFLRTLLASLCLRYHPHEVNIVAVDFKHGVLYRGLEELPHLVGTLSNLGPSEGLGVLEEAYTWRAVRALNAEHQRRGKLFRRAGVIELRDYQSKWRAGEVEEPLPLILIVVDEFAQLKRSSPELFGRLVQLAQVGRSTGLWLLLATQHPGGCVTDELAATLNYRICFKTSRRSDSKEIIGIPDAHFVTQKGRGYLQSSNSCELFQSAWAGAGVSERQDGGIKNVSLDGSRQPLKVTDTGSGPTQLQAVVSRVADHAERMNLKRLAGPWLPPLEEHYCVTALGGNAWNGQSWEPPQGWLHSCVGVYDSPARKEQGALLLDFSKERNLALFGRAQSGVSEALVTLLVSLASRHDPESVNFYLVDLGTRVLAPLRDLPHTGDLILPGETDKMSRFLRFITAEMAKRKGLFAEAGVGTLEAYRESRPDSMPAIFVVLENLAGLKTFGAEPGGATSDRYLEWLELLAQVSREGPDLGVGLVVSSDAGGQATLVGKFGMKRRLVFQLADSAGYRAVLGTTDGLEPAPIRGRGLFNENPVIEFQAGHAVEGATDVQRSQCLRALMRAMNGGWQGRRPNPVPVVPDTVPLRTVLAAQTETGETVAEVSGTVSFALDIDLVSPFAVGLEKGPHFVITGNDQDQNTTLLKAWLKALAFENAPERFALHLIDLDQGALSDLTRLPQVGGFADSGSQVANLVTELERIHTERVAGFKSFRERAQKQFASRRGFLRGQPLIVVAIENYQAFFAEVEPNLQQRMSALVSNWRDNGIHFLTNAPLRFLKELRRSREAENKIALARALIVSRAGFLLGTSNDEGVFGLSSYPKPSRLKPDEGYYIEKQAVHGRVKVPTLDPSLLDEIGSLAD